VILDTIKIAVAAFVLCVLQLSAAPQITPGTATPDLVIVLVIGVAMFRGQEAAVVTGFASGLLLDAMQAERLGVSSLLYMAAGLVVARRLEPKDEVVPTRFGLPQAPAQFLYVMAGAVVVQLGLAFGHALLGDSYPVRYLFSNTVIPTLVATAVAAFVLLPLIRRLLPPSIPRFDVSAIAAA
jgi:rod shape-determining protein MreD